MAPKLDISGLGFEKCFIVPVSMILSEYIIF